MPAVTNAGQAIKIAKQIINDAGYFVAQISSVEFDEKDGIWEVEAYSADINIHIQIDADDGEVTDFSTES